MLPKNFEPNIHELSYIAHILNKWDLLRSPLATELVIRAFMELVGTGRDFLEGVAKFEARNNITIRDKSTPPHVYFEPVMEMAGNAEYDHLKFEIDTLLEIDKQKAVITVGIIERFQDFFVAQKTEQNIGNAFCDASAETCEKDALKQAMHITGTIVRQVINHLMDTHHAEVNFNKNPWIRAEIPLRHTSERDASATRACYHRQVA